MTTFPPSKNSANAPGLPPPQLSAPFSPLGARQFGRVNWIGLGALIRREILRFVKVSSQTLVAPIATAALFLAVFSLAFGAGRAGPAGMDFATFIAPGVIMMTVIQNAFANTSSSLMIMKSQGSIADLITPPLSAGELTLGLAVGGVARGAVIAVIGVAALFPWVDLGVPKLGWAVSFAVIGALIMSLLGTIAAIWAQKFDHIAAVTNFVVTPLAFLSGSFYSVSRLPEPWRELSSYNPVFYLIDGFRYAATGWRDADPWLGLGVSVATAALLWLVCWRMLHTGYRLKS